MSEDLTKLNLAELLDLLEPMPEPGSVSLWPQTQGWIWLAMVVTAAAAWLIRRGVKIYRANAYRRAAVKQLEEAGDNPIAIAEIVRRTALAAYPRAEVAGLYGERWLDFLDAACDGNAFCSGPGRMLATAPYAATEQVDGLKEVAIAWVRGHRKPESAAS